MGYAARGEQRPGKYLWIWIPLIVIALNITVHFSRSCMDSQEATANSSAPSWKADNSAAADYPVGTIQTVVPGDDCPVLTDRGGCTSAKSCDLLAREGRLFWVAGGTQVMITGSCYAAYDNPDFGKALVYKVRIVDGAAQGRTGFMLTNAFACEPSQPVVIFPPQ